MSNIKLMPVLVGIDEPVIGCIGHNRVHPHFIFTEIHVELDVVNKLGEYKNSKFSHLYMISNRAIRESNIGKYVWDDYLKEVVILTEELYNIRHTKQYFQIEASTKRDSFLYNIPNTALLQYVSKNGNIEGEMSHPMYVTLTTDEDEEGQYLRPLIMDNHVMVENDPVVERTHTTSEIHKIIDDVHDKLMNEVGGDHEYNGCGHLIEKIKEAL